MYYNRFATQHRQSSVYPHTEPQLIPIVVQGKRTQISVYIYIDVCTCMIVKNNIYDVHLAMKYSDVATYIQVHTSNNRFIYNYTLYTILVNQTSILYLVLKLCFSCIVFGKM